MEMKLFEPAQAFQFDAKIDYSTEGIVSKRVIDRPTGNVTLFAFDSNQRLSEQSAPFDALVQVMEGEAEIVIGGKSNMLSAGQAIIMPEGERRERMRRMRRVIRTHDIFWWVDSFMRAAIDRQLDDFPVLEEYIPEMEDCGGTAWPAIPADQFGPMPEMSER